jgi:hypothetical protein
MVFSLAGEADTVVLSAFFLELKRRPYTCGFRLSKKDADVDTSSEISRAGLIIN